MNEVIEAPTLKHIPAQLDHLKTLANNLAGELLILEKQVLPIAVTRADAPLNNNAPDAPMAMSPTSLEIQAITGVVEAAVVKIHAIQDSLQLPAIVRPLSDFN